MNENKRKIKLKDYEYFNAYRKNGNHNQKDLVQGITPRKSLTLNYGVPKCGKSLFELYKCLCLSRGLKFLGKFKTQKTNCLYIDLENSENLIEERELVLKKFLKKRKHNVFFITRDSNVNILDKECIEELREIIKERNIGYMTIDTLPKAANYDCKEERDVNSLFISFFQPLIDEFNLSITFLLHTTKKGDSFLGSQAYKGIVDCCYEFRKTYDKENMVHTEIHSDNRGSNLSLGVKFIFDIIEDKEGYSSLKGLDISYFDIEERRAGSSSFKKPSESHNKQLTQDIIALFKGDIELQKSDVILGLEKIGYDKDKISKLDSSIKRTLSWLSKSKGTNGSEILFKTGQGKATRYRLNNKDNNLPTQTNS